MKKQQVQSHMNKVKRSVSQTLMKHGVSSDAHQDVKKIFRDSSQVLQKGDLQKGPSGKKPKIMGPGGIKPKDYPGATLPVKEGARRIVVNPNT
jgi:hypothetical protein